MLCKYMLLYVGNVTMLCALITVIVAMKEWASGILAAVLYRRRQRYVAANQGAEGAQLHMA